MNGSRDRSLSIPSAFLSIVSEMKTIILLLLAPPSANVLSTN